jgi:hypothetical protein
MEIRINKFDRNQVNTYFQINLKILLTIKIKQSREQNFTVVRKT